MLRPGVLRAPDRRARAAAPLRDGLGARRGDQRRLGRPLQPASARLLRPAAAPGRPGVLRHHPLVHGLPDVLLPHVQRRRRHARRSSTRTSGAASGSTPRSSSSGPGMTTDKIAEVWPTAQELGFPDEETCFGLQFGHGIGVGLYEPPMISRVHSLDHPVELEEGMVFALETYCAATDGRSAARIEEEVVVTATGCEVITRFPAEELLVAGKVYVRGADLLPTALPGGDGAAAAVAASAVVGRGRSMSSETGTRYLADGMPSYRLVRREEVELAEALPGAASGLEACRARRRRRTARRTWRSRSSRSRTGTSTRTCTRSRRASTSSRASPSSTSTAAACGSSRAPAASCRSACRTRCGATGARAGSRWRAPRPRAGRERHVLPRPGAGHAAGAARRPRPAQPQPVPPRRGPDGPRRPQARRRRSALRRSPRAWRPPCSPTAASP